MRGLASHRSLFAALALSFSCATYLGASVEKRLIYSPIDGMLVYGQEADDEGGGTGAQRLSQTPDAYMAAYSFKNFNGDRLNINFSLKKAAWKQYESGFGYYKKDIAEIDNWLNNARQGAYQYAVKNHKTQAQMDVALKALDKEKERKVQEYMISRGFRLLPNNTVTVDVPGVVKRNAPLLNSLAGAFDSVGSKRGYDSENLIGAAASMVQTALIYREPPTIDPDGRHTGGILQPATALLKGWGDCDTKTTLLASILANWPQMRMVGVAVPHHYLMGVLRIPNRGEVFVEHDGLQYVLVEPAGPAWLPPGQVAQTTIPLLEGMDGYRIDPLF